MSATTISWTNVTWNPTSGCTRVSAGCDNCYAVVMTRRLAAMGQEKYDGLINLGKSHFNGTVKMHPDDLEKPLRWKKPRMVFVNSMSDLFHKDVPRGFIDRVFTVMERTPQHTYQILTKRDGGLLGYSENMSRFGVKWPPNVWMGVSVENQDAAFRIDYLTATGARVKFVSLEPLIGPLPDLNLTGIDWAIVGGESGPGARPMDLDWVRAIRDECERTGTALFVKQMGSVYARAKGMSDGKGEAFAEFPPDLQIRQYPEVRS